LQRTIAINAEMITFLENSIPEKVFDYAGKVEMVFFVKEYLSILQELHWLFRDQQLVILFTQDEIED
jgi:hypothetical protein